jgi:hypothetical protein
MTFNMTKIAAGLVLAAAVTGAQAAPQAWTGEFTMYNNLGVLQDANDGAAGNAAAVTGYIDIAAGTFTLASTDSFFGDYWYTHDAQLYGPGQSPLISTADTIGNTCAASTQNCASSTKSYQSPVIGANQLLGVTKFQYGLDTSVVPNEVVNDGIDVFLLWDVATVGGVTTYTVVDIDWTGIATPMAANGTPGTKMVDGPFPNWSANFNMTAAVPEASTYGMMLAGLGLVGFAVRRRNLAA